MQLKYFLNSINIRRLLMIKQSEPDSKEKGECILTCNCKGIRTCALCEDSKDSILKNKQKLVESSTTVNLGRIVHHKEIGPSVLEFFISKQSILDHLQKLDLNLVCPELFLPEFKGLFIVQNCFELEEVHQILSEISKTAWSASQSGRLKQDFGVKINYKKRKIKSKLEDIQFPKYKQVIEEKLSKLNLEPFNNFSIHEIGNLFYQKELKSHIEPHIDDAWVWGDRIVGINLLSNIKMSFTHEVELIEAGKRLTFEIELPIGENEIYMMSRESRQIWKHGVKSENIEKDRIVITCREFVKDISII